MTLSNSLVASIVAILACVLAGNARSADQTGGACVHRPAPAGATGKRVAVVVGNGGYANGIPALPNPTHDAAAASKAVGALGFDVFLSTDADSETLRRCLDAAYASLAEADVALFSYSGHGIQIRDEGLEVWDLARDTVAMVKAPIVNILGIDPRGDYVSVIAMSADAQGFYRLASGTKGHPDTVPEGFVIYGSRVRNTSGGLVSQDLSANAWRDWPDETLFGPALVQKALAESTGARREEIARERITFAEVAALHP